MLEASSRTRAHHRPVRFAAGLLVALLAVPIVSCGSDSSGSRSTPTWPVDTVQGWVDAGPAVVGASVQVLDGDGRPLLAEPVVTDAFGHFTTDIPFSSDLVVVATNGTLDGKPFNGTLRAPLEADRAHDDALGMVDVNIATTLQAAAMQVDPSLSESDAASRTTQLLGLAPETNLGADISLTDSEFDQAMFVATASAGDGFDATVLRYATLGPGSVPPGALPDTDPETATVLQVSATPTAIPADVVTGIVTDILKDQGKRLISQWLGLPSDSKDLAEINLKLDKILSKLTDLDRQVAQLAANTVFQSTMDALRPYVSKIQAMVRVYLKPMASAAELARSTADAAAKAPGDTARADAAKSARDAYDVSLGNFKRDYSAQVGGAYNVIAGFLTPGPGGSATVLRKYADTLQPKRFLTTADGVNMRDLYTYLASWQGVSAYMDAEYQSATGGAYKEVIKLYDENVASQLASLPQILPSFRDEYLVLDMSTGLIWASRGTRAKTSWGPNGAWGPVPTNSTDQLREYWGTDPGIPKTRIGGWHAPTITELQVLRGDGDLAQVLRSASSETGFDNAYWSSGSAAGPWWTSTVDTNQSLCLTPPNIRPTPGHQMLYNGGKVETWPYMVGAVWGLNCDQAIKELYAIATAYYLPVRNKTASERYLP